ncbi:hypothetical protein PCC8801_0495 [Rippkaea orientalis PCC 8801]|uniref:Uncharacterized protein n=1 Tax=Rippkaea orientalis (strain PCC 8801 / RF-1) TaxID=41431 RepID=B7JVL6_RIPO1|nr:hypothetical protein [Rippkaea orientalis]ACK64587.1 hypothetical protein PCC8801_0495 [Rippkaea orientalis PCC 8801]
MSISTFGKQLNIPEQYRQTVESFLYDNYITMLIEYVASLHNTGAISYNTCEYLIRELYSKTIEQMVERQIDQKLEKMAVKLNKKALSMSIV